MRNQAFLGAANDARLLASVDQLILNSVLRNEWKRASFNEYNVVAALMSYLIKSYTSYD